jgi:hypothetical protein
MLVALGFLAASLLGLLVASAFWSRAVRLTTVRIKQSMPVSEPEIRADRDKLRAEYAIRVHKLEKQLDQAKIERARQLIDLNRRDASISMLGTDLAQMKAELEENQNARRVLEQTVADRLPRVEARLAEAKRLLFNRDREIAELTAGAKRHKQALEEVSSINAQKSAQIERLSTALTTRGGGRGRQSASSGVDAEVALRSEIEALRNKSSEQALLIDRLQRRLGSGFAAAESGIQTQPEGESPTARKEISEAESAIASARAVAAPTDAGAIAHEREVRALRARTEDQAGEIARLKAALVSFEQEDGKAGGLKDSRIGLKARLNSAQAQADQQTATIAKLRAELAAAHERLARQAAHFMGEMRRIGGPTQPSGPARRPMREERRSLAERVAQIRTGGGPAERVEQPRAPEAPRRLEPPAANGHGGEGNVAAAAEEKEPPENSVSLPPAAEMPQASEIPDKRRRPRLLDRITGLAKS